VIQVKMGSTIGGNTTSQTFVNTGLYVDIAPKFASSIIYIDVMIGGLYLYQTGYRLRMVRDGTVCGEGNQELYGYGTTTATTAYVRRQANYNISDQPNTIISVRYELQFRSQSGGAVEIANGASFSTIRAMEIKQ
jgi:hypothetical protein